MQWWIHARMHVEERAGIMSITLLLSILVTFTASLNCYIAYNTMGLEATSTPPTSISREEHTSLTSQTPQSFGDIPPILRFQDQVEITLTPSTSEASGSSVNYEGRIQGQFWVTEA
jgi:hypothetical protein